MIASNINPPLPQSKEQFEQCFPSEQACCDYVRRLRWPDGFKCAVCGSTQAWQTRRGLMRCSKCQRQCSITSGTIFEGTRKPLRDWLHAIWYVVSRKSGVSALGLQRELKLPSYQTAWVWLHRLRQAMVLAQVPLRGQVEAGPVVLSGPQDGAIDAGWRSKVIIAVAVERDGPEFGCIRLRQICRNSPGEWEAFLKDAIAPGATVHARRSITVAAGPGVAEHRPITHVQYVASALNRWLRGTYCGAIDPRYLAYYLDEFTFRANHRRTTSRGELFQILVIDAIRRPPEVRAPAMAARPADVDEWTRPPWPSRPTPEAPAGIGTVAMRIACPPPGTTLPDVALRGEQKEAAP